MDDRDDLVRRIERLEREIDRLKNDMRYAQDRASEAELNALIALTVILDRLFAQGVADRDFMLAGLQKVSEGDLESPKPGHRLVWLLAQHFSRPIAEILDFQELAEALQKSGPDFPDPDGE